MYERSAASMFYYFRLMDALEMWQRTFFILGALLLVEAEALAPLMRRPGSTATLVRVAFWLALTLAAGLVALGGYVRWQMGQVPLHIPFVRLQDGSIQYIQPMVARVAYAAAYPAVLLTVVSLLLGIALVVRALVDRVRYGRHRTVRLDGLA
jgi:hypothetical protein